jgi:hypothetical protein
MTTFADMLTQVYTITGRSDLVTETTLALRQATLKAHNSDFFPLDIYEFAINFSSAAYYQQLDYQTLVPLWRSLKYIRKYDSVGQTAGKFLKIITPELLMDKYQVEQTDIVYIAGTQLQIKTSDSNQYFLVACYVNPNTDPANYSSWIANVQDTVIVTIAATIVFKMIGFDEQAQSYAALAADQLAMLKESYLLANGW